MLTDESTPQLHPAAPVIALLQELSVLVSATDQAQYTQTPVGLMPGTIGGHVRHCLDHVQSLLDSLGTGFLDYDDRQRNTNIESDPAAAVQRMHEQIDRLAALPVTFVQAAISLRVIMVPGLPAAEVESSIGRELAFVLSHTIHHNAIVGAMARTLGLAVPERFGYAPATVDFLNKPGCQK